MSLDLPAIAALGTFSSVLFAMLAWWAARRPVAPLRDPEAVHDAAVSPFTRALTALGGADDRSMLAQAGYSDRRALETFWLARVVGAIALTPVAAALSAGSAVGAAGGGLLGLVAGVQLPVWLASWRRSARQDRIQAAVPDMLDLLVSCLEAGLAMDRALHFVAREIRLTCTDLADELDRVTAETHAGVPRATSLRGIEDRTGVESLAAVARMIAQTERYGSSVATSLRAHARLSRRRRCQEAEERAAQAAPKMTVVMITCILPALFVVVLGPVAVQIVADVIGGGGG